MGCNHCLPEIPAGAEIIARATTWNRVVYRHASKVHCVLKDSVTPGRVIRRQQFIAAHSDLFAPFEYDLQSHTTIRDDLGDGPPTPEEFRRIRAALAARNLRVGDITPANIRGGKIIDFDLRGPHRPHGAAPPTGVTIKRWPNGGSSITVHNATSAQLVAAGLTQE